MSAHRIPNLRRDLPITVVLLVMAIVAVVPGAISAIIALAGFTGLMLLRLRMGRILESRGRAFRHPRWNAQSERASTEGGSMRRVSA